MPSHFPPLGSRLKGINFPTLRWGSCDIPPLLHNWDPLPLVLCVASVILSCQPQWLGELYHVLQPTYHNVTTPSCKMWSLTISTADIVWDQWHFPTSNLDSSCGIQEIQMLAGPLQIKCSQLHQTSSDPWFHLPSEKSRISSFDWLQRTLGFFVP